MSYILCIRAAIVKGYRHYNCADLSFKISIFKRAYLRYKCYLVLPLLCLVMRSPQRFRGTKNEKNSNEISK